jgi:hypothetical protein
MTSKTPSTPKTTTRKVKKDVASRARGLVSSARDLAGQVGAVSATLVETLPDAADTVKGSALDAYHTVETMPKSQRRQVATFSVLIGAALWVLGAPRLLTVLAFIPAIAVGGTRLARTKARS